MPKMDVPSADGAKQSLDKLLSKLPFGK